MSFFSFFNLFSWQCDGTSLLLTSCLSSVLVFVSRWSSQPPSIPWTCFYCVALDGHDRQCNRESWETAGDSWWKLLQAEKHQWCSNSNAKAQVSWCHVVHWWLFLANTFLFLNTTLAIVYSNVVSNASSVSSCASLFCLDWFTITPPKI